MPYGILIIGLTSNDSLLRLKSFFKSPAILSIFLIFFIYVFSGINSENSDMWLSRLNSNLIYLVYPLGVYLSGPYKKSFINKILACFVIINFLVSTYLFFNYIIEFNTVNETYLKGQTINTPIIHVRFSYFVAISILFSVYLFFQNLVFGIKSEKYVYAFIGLFLLMFIHIMAVRTGILSLYITVIVTAFYFAIKQKRWKLALIPIGTLFGFLIISYMYLPSFKNKIDYVKWDISNTLNDTAEFHTSDRIRINSIMNGLKIVKESPILGSGIGDIEMEMDKKYQIYYPDLPKEMRFEPINQFVFTLASMGILGFVLFYGLLLFPLVFIKKKHILLIPFYILTLSTFIGETTIELLVGKSAFLLILTILICYKEEVKQES